METYSEMSKYRLYAKAVAIADLVLSAISILLLIGLVIFVGIAAATANDKKLQDKIQTRIGPDRNSAAFINAAIWIFIVVAAAFAIFTALQMWAAIKLMSATDIGREPVEALRLAAKWRNVSIILFTLGIIWLYFSAIYILVAVNLLRGAMLYYIVFRYMQELGMMLNPSFPVSVTVQK